MRVYMYCWLRSVVLVYVPGTMAAIYVIISYVSFNLLA